MRFSVDSSNARRVRERGLCGRAGQVTIRYLPDAAFHYSPVVSKRQGNAPGRNRVKRIIREVMRTGEGSFPNGYYLVTWNGPCARMNRVELKNSIRAILETIRTGIQKDSLKTRE